MFDTKKCKLSFYMSFIWSKKNKQGSSLHPLSVKYVCANVAHIEHAVRLQSWLKWPDKSTNGCPRARKICVSFCFLKPLLFFFLFFCFKLLHPVSLKVQDVLYFRLLIYTSSCFWHVTTIISVKAQCVSGRRRQSHSNADVSCVFEQTVLRGGRVTCSNLILL